MTINFQKQVDGHLFPRTRAQILQAIEDGRQSDAVSLIYDLAFAAWELDSIYSY